MKSSVPIDQGEGLRELTRKERDFLRVYFDSGDPGKAALESGIARKGTDPTDAALQGARLLEEIQPQLRVLMAVGGLSDQVLIKAILEGINAMVVRSYTDETTKKRVYETTEIPDWRTRKFYHNLMAQMGFLIGSAAAETGKAAVDEVAARRDHLAREHRKTVSNMTDAQINALIEEEARGRQGSIRRAVS